MGFEVGTAESETGRPLARGRKLEEEALGGAVAGSEQAGGGEAVAGDEDAGAGGEAAGEAVGLVDDGGGDAEESGCRA